MKRKIDPDDNLDNIIVISRSEYEGLLKSEMEYAKLLTDLAKYRKEEK